MIFISDVLSNRFKTYPCHKKTENIISAMNLSSFFKNALRTSVGQTGWTESQIILSIVFYVVYHAH